MDMRLSAKQRSMHVWALYTLPEVDDGLTGHYRLPIRITPAAMSF